MKSLKMCFVVRKVLFGFEDYYYVMLCKINEKHTNVFPNNYKKTLTVSGKIMRRIQNTYKYIRLRKITLQIVNR